MRDEARREWLKCCARNARLQRAHREHPYKTRAADCYGHCPMVIYNKDRNGARRRVKEFEFDYTNEIGLCSRVYGRVAMGTDIRFLPYLDKRYNLIIYNQRLGMWENSGVNFGVHCWDLNKDGTFVHLSEPSTPGSSGSFPSQLDVAEQADNKLICTLGTEKYYSLIEHPQGLLH